MSFSILFGGVSFEHEISIISAITLKKRLNKHIDNFIFIDIEGDIYLINEANLNASFFADLKYKNEPKLHFCENGFCYKNLFGKSKQIKTNILINLIHGAGGEDGKIASLLDFYGINFVGPRVEACTLSFNKALTKTLAKAKNINILPYEVLNINSTRQAFLGYPIIIKPLRSGSSLGINVANNAREFDYALDSAFAFDKEVIVEPFIPNIKEFNLAGGKTKSTELVFSLIEEPKKNQLLSFENKYLDFSREEKINKAEISPKLEYELRDAFSKIYNDLFLGAIIRCDFFVHEGKIILNEINPIPGSLAHYLFEDFLELLSNLALPSLKKPNINYSYINKIKKAK